MSRRSVVTARAAALVVLAAATWGVVVVSSSHPANVKIIDEYAKYESAQQLPDPVTSAPPAPVGPATVSVPPADVTLPGGTHASVGVNLTPSDRSRPVDPSVATRAIRETLIWDHATPASDRAELRMLLRAAVLTSYAGGVSDMRITRLDLTP